MPKGIRTDRYANEGKWVIYKAITGKWILTKHTSLWTGGYFARKDSHHECLQAMHACEVAYSTY